MNHEELRKQRPNAQMLVDEIKEFLPHRYPFLLVDRIISLEPGVRCQGLKNVTGNEPFFNGHFPGFPIMPGVLILEALAQTCGILAYSVAEESKDRLLLYAGVDKARFKAPVVPGDQLIMDVEYVNSRLNFYVFHAVGRVDGKVAAEGDLRMALVPKPA